MCKCIIIFTNSIRWNEYRQSKKNLYKEKHSYKSKHNKVKTINDINFKNRTPKIMSFCQNY